MNAFIDTLLKELSVYKLHQENKISQFRRIKEIRKIVEDQKNKSIALRMDWSENVTSFQCRQEKSAYYYDIQASVNTVVMYSADGVKCAGTIADVKAHRCSAVWASLMAILDSAALNLEHLDHLYIITDSPLNQYRNSGCMFLAKRFAEQEIIKP